MTVEQLDMDAALAFAKSEKWREMSAVEIARFQLEQELLCMPFDVFHKSVENALGRPVFTHEFGLNRAGLLAELNGGPQPTLAEVIELIPEDKRIVVELDALDE
jgi:hypothetical protein